MVEVLEGRGTNALATGVQGCWCPQNFRPPREKPAREPNGLDQGDPGEDEPWREPGALPLEEADGVVRVGDRQGRDGLPMILARGVAKSGGRKGACLQLQAAERPLQG